MILKEIFAYIKKTKLIRAKVKYTYFPLQKHPNYLSSFNYHKSTLH